MKITNEKLNFKISNKGITLITLIVTIIVLLILASVSIAMLTGENGILTQAQRAKEETEVASEKEGLSLDVIEYQMNKESNTKLGTDLYTKNADNSTIWDVIVANEITYGTDWNYVEEGTNIDGYGRTQNNYLVNYETGEIIELEEGEYTRLTHGDNIGVTEGLIFNLDPSIIDTTDIEDLKAGNYESLWQNTTLNGFDWTENSGLTKTEFNFDGINDYITVKYDSEEQKNTLAQNGFTFEYYGTIEKGKSYYENEEKSSDYAGIFGYWSGNENQQAKIRFGMRKCYWDTSAELCLVWNSGLYYGDESNYISDFSEPDYPWNIWYPVDYKYGDEIYYTVTVDTTTSYEKNGKKYYKQKVYLDGKELYEGDFNKKQWEDFVNKDLKNLNYFCIGRSSMHAEGWWHYSKMNAYTLRLYNRALTSDEVTNNYNKSIAYHESLQ